LDYLGEEMKEFIEKDPNCCVSVLLLLCLSTTCPLYHFMKNGENVEFNSSQPVFIRHRFLGMIEIQIIFAEELQDLNPISVGDVLTIDDII
jgi:hypothetical protein